MLFYRRRSNGPLGGPNLHRVLQRFVEDDNDDEMSGLGEGQRLGEGFSQTGSSSTLQGAGVSHLAENRGGTSNTSSYLPYADTAADDKEDDDIPLLASSRFQSGQTIDDDEGIELEDSKPNAQPFATLTTWNFENISSAVAGSPFDSGAASDEAQHDSSNDERALSLADDIDSSFPGLSEYKLSQPEDLPSYLDHLTPDCPDQPSTDSMHGITHEVLEVIPTSEQEPQSDDAAEIHVDDNDKIKVP